VLNNLEGSVTKVRFYLIRRATYSLGILAPEDVARCFPREHYSEIFPYWRVIGPVARSEEKNT
jgi:hypothetical protein